MSSFNKVIIKLIISPNKVILQYYLYTVVTFQFSNDPFLRSYLQTDQTRKNGCEISLVLNKILKKRTMLTRK